MTGVIETKPVLPVAVFNVKLREADKIYVYTPENDITTFELANILTLVCALEYPFIRFEYGKFIEDKKLTRHFEVIHERDSDYSSDTKQ